MPEVVVNRQTVAVAVGTVSVLTIGGLLLYANPAPKATRPDTHEPEPDAPREGKSKGSGPRHLGEKQLVHAGEVPADRVAAPAGAPNVVVIFASTQRRDQWTPYGGPASTTPYLDSVAKTGVKMTDALAATVDPRTAAAALVTGQYPHRVGLVEPGEQKNFRDLAPQFDTLAERFQGAGWMTVGGTGNHHLNVKAGTAQGFDWYRDSQPFSLMIEQRMDAAEVVDNVVERVAARTPAEKARPLYVQVAFVDSHKPFKVKPEESKVFEVEGDPCDCAPYRATVHRVDEAVRKLVEGLAALGLTPENTVFTIIADHGEGLDLPVAHRKQHGFVLYRSSVQIPWLVWGRGIRTGESGDLVSQLDFAPTVGALAGLPVPEGLDGIDVSAAVLGTGPAGRQLVYADTMYAGAHRASVWTTTQQCQKEYGSEIEEEDNFQTACFDRVADPDFAKAVENAELMARLDTVHAELLSTIGAPTKTKVPGKAKAADVEEGEGKAKGKGKGKGKAKGN